jgi:hypothetical protein
MPLRDHVEMALSCLIGEPMWASGLAASMLWLQFGQELVARDHRGKARTVGRHALHIDCPWQWLEASGDVRADHDFSHEELVVLGGARPVCESVQADERGGFRLRFADGSTLVVEPDTAAEEYWRLLEPGRDTPHFVVGANGVEE